mgnify:CR=1 FL=1
MDYPAHPDARRIARVDPVHLIFSIWALTQHYADFDVQVRAVLFGLLADFGRHLDIGFERACQRAFQLALRIGLVERGAADPDPRAAPRRTRAHECISGQRVPIVGRVSMDWTTADVTDVEGVSVGDDVTIIGSDGAEQIRAEDLARLTNTISYEITCGISRRVNRRYIP